MPRYLVGIALCTLLGCTQQADDKVQPVPPQAKPLPANPEPEPGPNLKVPELSKRKFTLTALSYLTEFEADTEATEHKYRDNILEITGWVWSCKIEEGYHGLYVLCEEKPNPAKPKLIYVSLAPPDVEKKEQYRHLSRGQFIKLRTVGGNAYAGYLLHAKLIEVGPTRAKATTLTEIKHDFMQPGLTEYYDNKEVFVRVKVVESRPKGTLFTWVVTDPDIPNAPRCRLWESRSQLMRLEFAALKPGDIVSIMGFVEGPPESLEIRDPRIIESPPPGLKLTTKK